VLQTIRPEIAFFLCRIRFLHKRKLFVSAHGKYTSACVGFPRKAAGIDEVKYWASDNLLRKSQRESSEIDKGGKM
jgi:hypothetical protein